MQASIFGQLVFGFGQAFKYEMWDMKCEIRKKAKGRRDER